MSNLIKFIPDFKVTQHISMLESGQVEDWGYKYVNIAKYREMTNTCGEDIKVVILDTGSNPSHPDLKDNVKGEQDFTGDNCPLDSVGHSSHVAGIIGGIDNGIGVIGIAPKSSLYFGKVLNNQGLCPPDYSWIIKGLEWAIDMKADIVNMSLGAHIQPPEKMQKLVRSAAAQGMILVAASGNSQMQTIDYPGRYNEVISVAAMDKNGQLASYSNVGQELDFLAPGSDIYSTYLNGGYSKVSGTSMSAPFLSGIVALLLSYHRNGDEHHTPINSYVEVIEHIKKFEKGRVIDLGGDKGIGILDFSADPEKNITLSSIQKDMNFQIWQHITKDLFIKWVKRILRR